MAGMIKKIQKLKESQDPSAFEDIDKDSSLEYESEDNKSNAEEENEEEELVEEMNQASLKSFQNQKIELSKSSINPLESGEIPDYIAANVEARSSLANLQFKLDPLRAKDDSIHSTSYNELGFEKEFDYWKETLLQGFNLLLYGPGSKLEVLETFYEYLENDDPPRMIIKAYHPLMTIRKVLEGIWENLGKDPPMSGKPETLVTKTLNLLTEISKVSPFHFFIIIHNIEGQNFTLTETQDILSRIANHPAVHLVASLDNPYLLFRWSIDTNIRYNFIYIPATTFYPYTEELSVVENLPIFHKSTTFAQIRGTKYVLQSMTRIQRDILLQLANIHVTQPKGILFSEFYKICEDEILVTNQKQLKDFLIEARDHQMIVYKNSQSGESMIVMKTDPNILIELINEDS
ncbi:unnamed protein product [Blepharisma stoltei]|uniref:Origin recognition complex subunit 2 n=1 Tax=Blepharisma stoltei TaxID=1481888 RepID=A0AAU9JD73_9CILI|nr:unnamed protein product [Blepharisma stoltei]